MPSTMEVRSLGSSAIQSFRYQRSIASTCSLSSLPAPPSLSSVSNGTPSSASRFRNPGSSRQVAFSVPATGSQAQSSRGSL